MILMVLNLSVEKGQGWKWRCLHFFKHLKFKDLKKHYQESLWIEIFFKHTKSVASCYRRIYLTISTTCDHELDACTHTSNNNSEVKIIKCWYSSNHEPQHKNRDFNNVDQEPIYDIKMFCLDLFNRMVKSIFYTNMLSKSRSE